MHTVLQNISFKLCIQHRQTGIRQNKPNVIKNISFHSQRKAYPEKSIFKHDEDTGPKSLFKEQIHYNKDNKGGFQAVKMFISTHHSLKTTCTCILSLSVTDVI